MPDTVDAVSDTNSDRQDLLDGTVHRDDFVSNGCEMSISGTDVSIASGIAHRTYIGTYYRAYVSRRKFTVPDGAVTAIHYDFSAGEIVADGSTPSEPYLQIGEADTTGGTSTVDDTVAREPTRYGQMGSDENPNEEGWFKKLSGVADHIVRDLETFNNLFPDTQAAETPLSAGDVVLIAPEDGPIRYDSENYIDSQGSGNNLNGLTIYGQFSYGETFELKPADSGANPAFIINTPGDEVTIEGISHDGNQAAYSGTSTESKFIEHWQGVLYAGYNYAQDIHPYHVHNQGGNMFESAGFARTDGIYGYHNKVDNTGDRMWTIQNADNVHLYGERSSNGYDRMITMRGVVGGSIIGCRSTDHDEGSFIGFQDSTDSKTSDIFVAGNRVEGTHRNFANIIPAETGGVHNITFVGNTGIRTGGDLSRPAAVVGGNSGNSNITFLGNWFEGYPDGGFQLKDSSFFKADWNHFVDLGGPVFDFALDGDGDGSTDPILGEHNTWDTVPSLVNGLSNVTRPRWGAVIGGGPFGGVDLSTTTGQFDGDKARAEGASAASAYARAEWDDSLNTGSGGWHYIDPTGTI